MIPTSLSTATPWLAEFEASAISPELAFANVRWIEGEEAVVEFLEDAIAARQKNQSYLTASNARLLERYKHLKQGAWITYGINADGSPGRVGYAKPKQPRIDADGDQIKYETPPGAESRPILPDIESAWEAISARYGINRLEGEPFWKAVKRSGIPVVLTEGFKKALGLVEQGQPAIAIRGISQWHPKGNNKLWPELAQFCDGRQILICFDQDEKLRTQVDVARQGQYLGQAIKAAGSEVEYLVWDTAEGKGVDDVLVAQPVEQRFSWLSNVIEKALTLKQWRRLAAVRKSRSILQARSLKADRRTTGEYLPPLPNLKRGAIHALSATMNSGKTYRMGLDWVRPWVAAGGIVVTLTPLNSLGQQAAKAWGLPHIHDYHTDAVSQQALMADIRHRGGIAACPNSAHRVKQLIPQDAPLLLVIDEAAQTLNDAAEGGTLKEKWAERWEDMIELMQRAAANGAIALAEDGLDADTIGLVKTLSGAAETHIVSHQKEPQPWNVSLHAGTPLSGFRGNLLEALKAGKRILYVTTSQAEARRLAHWAENAGINHERIDSTTNEGGRYTKFFEEPDLWLRGRSPQLVILTPSGKTGLSIEGSVSAEDAYFDAVWGYFPSLDGDTHKQLLGRYRPAVPRHVWLPNYIQPDPGEAAGRKLIKRDFDLEAGRYAGAGGFGLSEADIHDDAIKCYLAGRRQRRWAQKINAARALEDALEDAGHTVERGSAEKNKEIAELWQGIKEQLAEKDASYHSGLEIQPEIHTPEWACQILRDNEATYEKRCAANKVLTAARFPGMNWDNSDLWYEAIFCPRHDAKADGTPSRGPLAPGAALWAEADHWESLWAEDIKTAREILQQRLRAAHLLPKNALKAKLAAKFKPLAEVLLVKGEVEPGCAIAEEMKAIALHFSSEIKRYWRLSCTEDQSSVAIANKILRKLGLVVARLRKVSGEHGRQWAYSVTAIPLWQKLVAARKQALGGGTDLLSPPNKQICTTRYSAPPLAPPPLSPVEGRSLLSVTDPPEKGKIKAS
ncbi:MAG: DUF3854 domain-containing protein [Leptolyngbya sp. SIO4C5]|nr:DUF3854 domain-containing protein [Leptolyngbya sp. SIO4C5]